jgi:hypothetical protein
MISDADRAIELATAAASEAGSMERRLRAVEKRLETAEKLLLSLFNVEPSGLYK